MIKDYCSMCDLNCQHNKKPARRKNVQRWVDSSGEFELPCNPGAVLESEYRAKNNPDKLPEAVAIWHLALTVNCPQCGRTFNITKLPDWQEHITPEVFESIRNVADEFECPNPKCKTKLLITDYVN